MAFINDQMIFYHIPKTGGRWVTSAMKAGGVGTGRAHRLPGRHPRERIYFEVVGSPEPACWIVPQQHSTPDAMEEKYKTRRFQFCFVRRPVAWYRSFWCYRLRTKNIDLRFPPDHLWDADFERFLENVAAAYPNGFLTELYQHYVGADNTRMDFVGRQEHLADDLVEVLALAGRGVDEKALRALKPRNVSAADPKLGARAVAGWQTVHKIEAAEHWILETFYA
jgi:hypothetical protein